MADKKAARTLFFIVPLAGYMHDALVAISPKSAEQIAKRLAKYGVEVDDEEMEWLRVAGRAKTTRLRGGVIVIQFREWEPTPYWHGVVAHEAYHAVCFLMDRVGVRHCDDSEEAFAYAIQSLAQGILAKLAKKRPARGKR
jgi:hypothetical protein